MPLHRFLPVILSGQGDLAVYNDHSNVRWKMQAKTSGYKKNSLHASLSSSFLFLYTSPSPEQHTHTHTHTHTQQQQQQLLQQLLPPMLLSILENPSWCFPRLQGLAKDNAAAHIAYAIAFVIEKSLAVSVIGTLLGNLLSYTPAFDNSEMGFWSLMMVMVPNSALIYGLMYRGAGRESPAEKPPLERSWKAW